MFSSPQVKILGSWTQKKQSHEIFDTWKQVSLTFLCIMHQALTQTTVPERQCIIFFLDFAH